MTKQNRNDLNKIVSNGYNMTVISLTETHVVISIGGSEREISLSSNRPLSDLINDLRSGLGCSRMTIADIEAIDTWQYGNN